MGFGVVEFHFSRILGGYQLMVHPVFHSSSSVMGSLSLLKAPGGGILDWRGEKREDFGHLGPGVEMFSIWLPPVLFNG